MSKTTDKEILMELHHLQTVLRVMNLTAPFECVWVASQVTVNSVNKEKYEMQAEIRYFLVPDNSELLTIEGIVAA